ncbi:acyl-coenzyme A:6-aminopenicillanic-acid-acyltransferase [Lineolata rhizophorae]|uniref:Acyl-coenzyme A:6-aminopenicillanic-acid-acyltransferase n=1 Tax=Lineolata rhizophorae TaxID=578093 RepID=A0A6A6P447_9PEZI|nr:acyl-coenzyme A:6-aminopenicillanic-acid-acyltransferase [Lineolata rhizophorae]
MLEIFCRGTPFEIGRQHGQQARAAVRRSIRFYATLFEEKSGMDWAQVRQTALEFETIIRQKWPAYLQEMSGLAVGAGVALTDIVALNVRTEIAFGLFQDPDGCTALAWHTEHSSFLCQNWDWEPAQKANLLRLRIFRPPLPAIAMVTEAGIIGKIGLNSHGVAVTLNAIKAAGLSRTRLPCHLALRRALESTSADAATLALKAEGVAAACAITVADPARAAALECSAKDVVELGPDRRGAVLHTNHYVAPHAVGVRDARYLPDSGPRLERLGELCDRVVEKSGVESGREVVLTTERLKEVFRDEKGLPGAICRAADGQSQTETLFGIVMDLRGRKADVTVGRPVDPEEQFVMRFG